MDKTKILDSFQEKASEAQKAHADTTEGFLVGLMKAFPDLQPEDVELVYEDRFEDGEMKRLVYVRKKSEIYQDQRDMRKTKHLRGEEL